MKNDFINFSWKEYRYDETINGKPALEAIAKLNNPIENPQAFEKPTKFFYAPTSIDIKYEGIDGGCLIPVDTEKGYNECKSRGTPIPFEMVEQWIFLHPNQRFYNNELFKTAISEGYATQEYIDLISEKGLLVEVPEEYKDKMF